MDCIMGRWRRARTGALAVDLDEWREAIDKGGSVQGGPITQAKDATNGAEQGDGTRRVIR